MRNTTTLYIGSGSKCSREYYYFMRSLVSVNFVELIMSTPAFKRRVEGRESGGQTGMP